ncbi:ROK family transcriptional regulator [Streptomyces sp. NPDC047028]|uniref:ROK family transcriptional regulator n=1 Tax=Streptomyces sp. NPDC047028 TaxID=3155793 RepID=UPI0034083DB1
MTEDLSGGDLSRLRQLNSLAVINALRGEPALTLTELAKRTGLSRASTEDVVRELLGRGWVAEAPAAAGTVGRPARRYRFRADAGRVLGVDIGGHKVLALVADLDGTVLHSVRVAVTPRLGRRQRLAAVDRAVREALAGAGLAAGEVWAVGAATTGLVDATGKVMLSEALPEWTGVDVAAHLGRLVPAPVLVENDSKLAALAESWCGVARYAKDVVVLLAGLRTGTGLIIDGKLHRGFGNAAGEIGALPASGWIRAQEHLQSWPPAAAGAGAGAGVDAGVGADSGAGPRAGGGTGAGGRSGVGDNGVVGGAEAGDNGGAAGGDNGVADGAEGGGPGGDAGAAAGLPAGLPNRPQGADQGVGQGDDQGGGRGRARRGDRTAPPVEDVDAAVEEVFRAARAGDRRAAAVVRRYVRDLAVGAAALVLTLDPELVVVGGGFSRSADLIVEPLRRELDRWCIRTPEVRVSEFGDEGVALGALRLALDHIDRGLREGDGIAAAEHFPRSRPRSS